MRLVYLLVPLVICAFQNCESPLTAAGPSSAWTSTTLSREAQTLSDLKTLTGTHTGERAKLLGYRVVNDGGEGLFTWMPESELVADDGVVISPWSPSDASTRPGRWVREFDGDLNALWFGCVNMDSSAGTIVAELNDDCSTRAVQTAKRLKKNLHYPAGTYRHKTYFPLRQRAPIVKQLESYEGIHVYGDGRTTIIKSAWIDGADVFQLHGVQDVTIRDLAVTGVKLDRRDLTQGINGISITGGGRNIRIERVHAFDLPWVQKDDYIDGGKGFTIQPGAGLQTSNIAIIDCSTENTSIGFGLDFSGDHATTDPAFAPREILVHGNSFASWYQGLYVSVSEVTNPSDPTHANLIPGMSVELSNNRVSGARYGLVLGRGSFVVVKQNIFSNMSPSTPLEDWSPTGWPPRVPIVAVGCHECVFDSNTLEDPMATAHLLIGGTIDGHGLGHAYFNSVKNNSFLSVPTSGYSIALWNAGGLVMRNSIFEQNNFPAAIPEGQRIDPSFFESDGVTARFQNSFL